MTYTFLHKNEYTVYMQPDSKSVQLLSTCATVYSI